MSSRLVTLSLTLLLVSASLGLHYRYSTLDQQPSNPGFTLAHGWLASAHSTTLSHPCEVISSRDTTTGYGFPFVYYQAQTGCNGTTINHALNLIGLILDVLLAVLCSLGTLLVATSWRPKRRRQTRRAHN